MVIVIEKDTRFIKRSHNVAEKVFLVFLTLIMSIFAVFAAAEESPGDRVISFDEPMILLISLGIILCLFIPPFVMSFLAAWL